MSFIVGQRIPDTSGNLNYTVLSVAAGGAKCVAIKAIDGGEESFVRVHVLGAESGAFGDSDAWSVGSKYATCKPYPITGLQLARALLEGVAAINA